jgi:hypothetical protein
MLTGLGAPNQVNTIEASPDLSVRFTSLGTVVPDASGAFAFEDQEAGTFTQRFYRLTLP